MSDTYEKIYAVVRKIPHGCVATYGQVARLAGIPRQARQVGYALHASSGKHDLPWHRVINAKGEVSTRSDPSCNGLQRQLLEDEGVVFNRNARVSLENYRWQPGLLNNHQ